MLVVAALISTLTVRIREQAEAARQRERRTAALYAMSRELAGTRGLDELLAAVTRHIADVFGGRVAVLLPGPRRPAGRVRAGEPAPGRDDASERGVAQWVHEHGQPAGRGTRHTCPAPPRSTSRCRRARGTSESSACGPPIRSALDARAAPPARDVRQPDGAGDRAGALAAEAQAAQVRVETERLRNTLLSSVSHDLRTPLAAITGAASALLDAARRSMPGRGASSRRRSHEEADRLNRLVTTCWR